MKLEIERRWWSQKPQNAILSMSMRQNCLLMAQMMAVVDAQDASSL